MVSTWAGAHDGHSNFPTLNYDLKLSPPKPPNYENVMDNASTDTRIRILTVGDGDLSLSLALVRAYGRHVSLTASVLESKERLLACYPDAPLEALADLNVEVLYKLDATKLHEHYKPKSWDLVCFHHPHLGLGSLEKNEAEHANRHFQLVCHYLSSANAVSDSVHICLCGSQPETWKLLEAAEFTGLELKKKMSTSAPFSKLWTDEEFPPTEAKPGYAAPRRYRFGKLGSRHALGKFGYRHRRTEGELYNGKSNDTNVAGSMHYLFRAKPGSIYVMDGTGIPKHKCKICRTPFSSERDLVKHMRAPAVPDTTSTTIVQTVKKALPIQDDQEIMPPIPCTTKADGTETSLKVEMGCDGKRLRWLIQHGIEGLSKKQAKVAIQGSKVFVNGSVAVDASRVLRFGDIVLVKAMQPAGSSSSVAEIEILYRKDPVLVAFKPSGVRTKGQFPGTLEASIEQQEGHRYDALSPLDTFCPGLCALIRSDHGAQPPTIAHSMTALVFKAVSETWKPYREVTITVEPKWKKRKRNMSPQKVSLKLVPLGTTKEREDSTQLTTIRLETGTRCSTSSICQYLRNESHGVVGDSNCRQEYLKVRRSIRNRIKDKMCIGCYRVEIDGVETTYEVPEKLLWSYWDAHCDGKNCSRKD
ncbi:unnamed protein product [Cylindrotheca closterium]|uniref:25S rRNA (uridine-N(3))-methyltransferase BMT5-like domain-containing protein n=1 Tax=Cylindrotheca closterium TaxID=2856 RepID=A0AAD2FTL3_9STRA|nr:unnamed protein product [Cylindrotheca closterium]